MRFFLVRHGQTAANASGLFYGSTDVPLTPLGIEQSTRVAGLLAEVSFSHALSSELQRAQQTAQLIVPVTGLDPRLNEIDFGRWEMRHFSNIAEEEPEAWQRWMDDWQNATPSGGEPFAHFAERVKAVAEELTLRQSPGDMLIVAHQGVLSLLLAHWLQMPTESLWHFPFKQDAYTMVENRDGFMMLRAFNDRSPFRTEE
ncbi:adenosylcobalamin/alpha-ribazole phosphatase [Leclercia adecarboxylata]|uniref:adenosylcobalamin/alpha-ribazole phosphatase n=1 Tax=Leclercia adecarboxylata TaxID=83655 RepID=UPI002DB98322|nr:adenosylcobalamin/alpha-ribazole phosphatase [Leclercia adecarboxylata]MEB6380941.1 adenosylcobalamin/alpha-ribazole phosphatase [Leclercia adecarboxylata]